MQRIALRDARIGLILVIAVACLIGLMAIASGGPGYLTANRTKIDVYFRDGQGVRAGHPVRVSGLDAGRVTRVDIVERDGGLRARVRIAISAEIAAQLKQDAMISVKNGITGSTSVNVVSVGESDVAWVPGQPIDGIESSLFDPLLEEIGLGPVERGHLSHTIGQVRQIVDDAAPRSQKILTDVQLTTARLSELSESAGPILTEAVDRVGPLIGQIEAAIAQANVLIDELEGTVRDNREPLRETVGHLRGAASEAELILTTQGPKLSGFLDGLEGTRQRADRVLFQADLSLGNIAQIIINGRPKIERSIRNVSDITTYGMQLVQKLRDNPLLISPLYRPGREAEQALVNLDVAYELLKISSEYNDALKRLEALQTRATSPEQSARIDAELQRAGFQFDTEFQPLLRQLQQEITMPDDSKRRVFPPLR